MSAQQQIVMNYVRPPGLDDLQTIAEEILDHLPDELVEAMDDVTLQVEDFPDEVLEQELKIEDPFEVLAVYRSGKELSPGVERKVAEEDDVLLLFRRPLLDLWCEQCDDLYVLLRQVMIEEIARFHEFSDDDIAAMVETHHQGLL